MSQQRVPDPIQLYEATARQTREFITGVKPGQLGDPTPCTEWNVQALLDHVIGVVAFGFGVLSGTGPQAPPAADNVLAAYEAGTARVLEAAREPGALDRRFSTPMGEMSGAKLLGLLSMDGLIHGWDLAKATGQDTALDSHLVDTCYALFAPGMDAMRASGRFGSEVEVPEGADTQVRLLGIMGRKA